MAPRSIGQLGALLRFARGEASTVGGERVRQGLVVARRIRWAPLSFNMRARLLSTLVPPASMYGCPVAGLPQTDINSLQSAIMRALWGETRKLRCKEIVLTLLAPGHQLDPVQQIGFQCLRMFGEVLRALPELRDTVTQVWALYASGASVAHGPIKEMRAALHMLGWEWVEPLVFRRPSRKNLGLFEGSDAWWQHEIRDGLRVAAWKRAASRRQDMQGLESDFGVDRAATLAHYRSSKTSSYEKGILRSFMSGSLRFQERLHQAGIADSAVCKFCGLADESAEHFLWYCPAWEHRHLAMAVPSASLRANWPACTKQ